MHFYKLSVYISVHTIKIKFKQGIVQMFVVLNLFKYIYFLNKFNTIFKKNVL